MDKACLFLFKLAWAARFRIPIIISIGFMAFDIRMQLEINVQMRQIRRHAMREENPSESESSEDESWVTFEDSDEEDEIESRLIEAPALNALNTLC